jgi:hypothetical protein
MDIHQEELIADWNLLITDSDYFKIDPLKWGGDFYEFENNRCHSNGRL